MWRRELWQTEGEIEIPQAFTVPQVYETELYSMGQNGPIHLTTALRCCYKWYFETIKVYADDATGKIESLAYDGVHLALWAQLVCLDKQHLDPQLNRFERYISEDLGSLSSSLASCVTEKVCRGTVNFTSEQVRRSRALSGWIADSLPDVEDTWETVSSPEIGPCPAGATGLDDACGASLSVRNSLSRLLSSGQKLAMERSLERWAEKAMTDENLAALSAIRNYKSDIEKRFGSIASVAAVKLHSNREAARLDSLLLQKLELRSEELRWLIPLGQDPELIQDISRSHSVCLFKNKIVLVEKRQNLDWMAEGADAIQTFLRIDSLAERMGRTPKPSTFCALDLVGYFSDRRSKEYGFVYAWPWDIGSVWDERFSPKTLNKYITESESDDFNVGPSLAERLKIARTIAICVRTFHLLGWLHKSINSHNVLLFPKEPSPEDPAAGDKLFLAGFEYSRQHGHNFTTEPITKTGEYDIYRHPAVTSFERRLAYPSMQQPFERNHDLYGLGLLLFELGIWNRIEIVQRDYYRDSGPGASNPWTGGSSRHIPTPHEFRDWITRRGKGSAEALLMFSSGDKYTEATMACLREEVADGTEYSSDLYAKVLEPLCYCAV